MFFMWRIVEIIEEGKDDDKVIEDMLLLEILVLDYELDESEEGVEVKWVLFIISFVIS